MAYASNIGYVTSAAAATIATFLKVQDTELKVSNDWLKQAVENIEGEAKAALAVKDSQVSAGKNAARATEQQAYGMFTAGGISMASGALAAGATVKTSSQTSKFDSEIASNQKYESAFAERRGTRVDGSTIGDEGTQTPSSEAQSRLQKMNTTSFHPPETPKLVEGDVQLIKTQTTVEEAQEGQKTTQSRIKDLKEQKNAQIQQTANHIGLLNGLSQGFANIGQAAFKIQEAKYQAAQGVDQGNATVQGANQKYFGAGTNMAQTQDTEFLKNADKVNDVLAQIASSNLRG